LNRPTVFPWYTRYRKACLSRFCRDSGSSCLPQLWQYFESLYLGRTSHIKHFCLGMLSPLVYFCNGMLPLTSRGSTKTARLDALAISLGSCPGLWATTVVERPIGACCCPRQHCLPSMPFSPILPLHADIGRHLGSIGRTVFFWRREVHRHSHTTAWVPCSALLLRSHGTRPSRIAYGDRSYHWLNPPNGRLGRFSSAQTRILRCQPSDGHGILRGASRSP